MVFGLLFLFVFSCPCIAADVNDILWDLDNINSIGGNNTTVVGQPKVIDTDKGKAIQFDGVKDGLIVDTLPLKGAEKFTIEVIVRPDVNGLQTQRFLNLKENDDKNRILMLMNTSPTDKIWYFETFVKNAAGTLDLYQTEKYYAAGKWYSVAMVYDGQKLYNYVNGVKEISEELAFTPLAEGKTSIGMKINKQSYFKGAIHKIRFSRQVLTPDEFLKP
jgi:hypothetical protein